MQISRAYRHVLWAAAACACCGGVQAQKATRGAWYVAPSLSLFMPDDQWIADRRAPGFGLKVGRVFDANWELRFGAETARSKKNSVTYRQTLFGLDAVYLFDASFRGFRPLVVFGVGNARDKVSSAGGRENSTPFLSAGLGLRYTVNHAMDLQVEWKTVHNISQHKSPSAFGQGNSDNYYLGLALNYSFGAREAPKPIAEPAPPPPPPPKPAPPPPPPPRPEVKPLPPPPPRTEKFTLQAVELFEFDSERLRMPQPKLDELAAAMKRDPSASSVTVIGHTDRLGSDTYNSALSQRRAESVKQYLVEKGVHPDRVQAVGKGESEPVIICTERKRSALIDCLAPNRRVEVEPITFERKLR